MHTSSWRKGTLLSPRPFSEGQKKKRRKNPPTVPGKRGEAPAGRTKTGEALPPLSSDSREGKGGRKKKRELRFPLGGQVEKEGLSRRHNRYRGKRVDYARKRLLGMSPRYPERKRYHRGQGEKGEPAECRGKNLLSYSRVREGLLCQEKKKRSVISFLDFIDGGEGENGSFAGRRERNRTIGGCPELPSPSEWGEGKERVLTRGPLSSFTKKEGKEEAATRPRWNVPCTLSLLRKVERGKKKRDLVLPASPAKRKGKGWPQPGPPSFLGERDGLFDSSFLVGGGEKGYRVSRDSVEKEAAPCFLHRERKKGKTH